MSPVPDRIYTIPILLLALSCFNRVNVSLGPQNESMVPLREVTLYESQASRLPLAKSVKKDILLIPVEGVVIDEMDAGGGAVYPGRIHRLLAEAATDSRFDAILLKVSSPGGSASASDTIYRMIRRFSQSRRVPVFVHIEGMGASGGYYIAMSGNHVNASPVSVVGSIGVIIRTFGVQGLMEKIGVEYRSIKSGKNKDILSPFSELTEEQKSSLQKQIDQNYETFLSVIRTGRGQRLPDAVLRRIADGNIYNAEQAKDFGLIDTVSPVEDYLNYIGQQIGASQVRVFSYLPEGRKDYNIYNTALPAEISPEARMMRLVRGGVYYVWEGGL